MARFDCANGMNLAFHGLQRAALLVLPMMPSQALAAGTPTAGNLAQLVLGLILVLAVIVGGAWLLRRYGQLPAAGHGALRVLGGVSLGPRERAVLIQLGDKQLLVGVAPGRVQTLHVFDQPAVTVSPEHGGGRQTLGAFSERLASLLRAGRSP